MRDNDYELEESGEGEERDEDFLLLLPLPARVARYVSKKTITFLPPSWDWDSQNNCAKSL